MSLRTVITSWTLVLVLFTHIVGVSMVYALYDFDKTQFIELFCVNKSKKEMRCDGACMLAKLNETSNSDKSKVSLKDFTEINFYITSDKVAISEPYCPGFKPVYQSVKPSIYYFDFTKDIFHPPGLI